MQLGTESIEKQIKALISVQRANVLINKEVDIFLEAFKEKLA